MATRQKKFLAQFTVHQRVRLDAWKQKVRTVDHLEVQLETQLQVRASEKCLHRAGCGFHGHGNSRPPLVATDEQRDLGAGRVSPAGGLTTSRGAGKAVLIPKHLPCPARGQALGPDPLSAVELGK